MRSKHLLSLALLLSFVAGVNAQQEPALKDPNAGAEVQDLVFFTKTRPVTIRLRVFLDGEPFSLRMTRFVEETHKLADRNGNGVLDGEEVRLVPTTAEMTRLMSGYPTFTSSGNAASAVLLKQMDSDADDKVTVDELHAYYKQAKIVPLQQVSQPNGAYNQRSALSAELFKQLDLNKDNKLSAEELKQAKRLIAKFDDNEDETLASTELPAQQQIVGGRRIGVNVGGGGVMRPGMAAPSGNELMIVPRENGTLQVAERLKMSKQIIARYDTDKTNRLSRSELGVDDETFARIDGNNNRVIDSVEMLRWLIKSPDVEVTLRLGKRNPDEKAMELIRKNELSPLGKQTSPGVVALPMGESTLEIHGVSGLANNRGAATIQSFQRVFQTLDTKKKGVVKIRDVSDARYRYYKPLLERADRNGDDDLTQKELTEYLEHLGGASRCTVSLQVVQVGRGLFELIDTNGDSRLSGREMNDAGKKLLAYDKNKDGTVTDVEIPFQYQLVVNPGQANYYYGRSGRVGQPTVQPVTRSGPIWFQKMDRNGDGDVSKREFLGPPHIFKELDTDGDGYVSPKEAEDAQARFGAKK